MSARSVFNLFRRPGSYLLLSMASLVPAQAGEDLGTQVSSQVKKIFDERQAAVVRVEAYDSHGKLAGTGFFADPSGTIYTLSHIVGEADEILVISGGKKMPARLLVNDPRSGLALIKVDETSPFIPVGDSRKLHLASCVMSIGYPVNFDCSPSFGLVAGLDRQFLGKFFTITHIRANIPVMPGFGGAPLLNTQGEAVGIIIAGISGGACFAVPIEAAEKLKMDYARFGEPRHGWVGVSVEEQPESVDGSHVRIVELGDDTPAAESGLKNGDVVLRVGGTSIHTADDIIDAAYFLTAGDKVTIEVNREGERMSMEVRSGRHPAMDKPSPSPEGMKDLHVLLPNSQPAPFNLNQ